MREENTVSGKPTTSSPTSDYRRQSLLQIWLPLFGTILVVLILAVLAIIGAVQGSSQVERWGNISAIWVIIPVLMGGVVLLAIVGGLAFGVTVLLRKTPGFMLNAQLLFLRISLMARKASDAIAQPIIKTNTLSARVATAWDRLFHRRPTVR